MSWYDLFELPPLAVAPNAGQLPDGGPPILPPAPGGPDWTPPGTPRQRGPIHPQAEGGILGPPIGGYGANRDAILAGPLGPLLKWLDDRGAEAKAFAPVAGTYVLLALLFLVGAWMLATGTATGRAVVRGAKKQGPPGMMET